MTRLAASQLRDGLTDTINRVAYGHERIILERYGKDLVAIVPLADLELLEALEDQADSEAIRTARAEAAREGTISLQDYKAKRG